MLQFNFLEKTSCSQNITTYSFIPKFIHYFFKKIMKPFLSSYYMSDSVPSCGDSKMKKLWSLTLEEISDKPIIYQSSSLRHILTSVTIASKFSNSTVFWKEHTPLMPILLHPAQGWVESKVLCSSLPWKFQHSHCTMTVALLGLPAPFSAYLLAGRV